MFAVTFDDFQRNINSKSVEEYPFEVVKVVTVMKGTSEYNAWVEMFIAEDDPASCLHIHVEPGGDIVTFFRMSGRKATVT